MVSALSPFWRVTASSPPLAGAIWRNSATVRIKGVFTAPVTCRLWLMLSRDGAGGPACTLTGSRPAIRVRNRTVFNMLHPFFCCTAHMRSSQYTQVDNDLQAVFFDPYFLALHISLCERMFHKTIDMLCPPRQTGLQGDTHERQNKPSPASSRSGFDRLQR